PAPVVEEPEEAPAPEPSSEPAPGAPAPALEESSAPAPEETPAQDTEEADEAAPLEETLDAPEGPGVVAMGAFSAPSPMALEEVPAATLHVDPYFVSEKYKGFAVDIKATNVTDATGVRITV